MAFWKTLVKIIAKPYSMRLSRKQAEKKAEKYLLELNKEIDEYIVLLATAAKTMECAKNVINKMDKLNRLLFILKLVNPHCGKKMQTKLCSVVKESLASMSILDTKGRC